jgi:lysophospholipase L1-like esterase
MKIISIWLAGMCALLWSTPALAASDETAKYEWSFTPDPALPNVLILGDSISIGYTLAVRARLKEKANVFRPLTSNGKGPENCSGTTLGVKAVDRWLTGRKWDVIHFNFGLHDMKRVTEAGGSRNSNKPEDPRQATVEQYAENLAAIVAKLKAAGARLVFATTTPVTAGTTNPWRDFTDPPRYNAAAVEIMNANGIRVNDLFALCEPQLGQIQARQNVHFNVKGSRVMAEQVARVIAEELEHIRAAAHHHKLD